MSAFGALFSPPEEAHFRRRFNFEDAPLEPVTSGWQMLVVVAPNRVFLFPRRERNVPMIEREAHGLQLSLPSMPRVVGQHRDESVYPHPFLETTRMRGRCWDLVDSPGLAFEQVAGCLEDLARHIARWHHAAVPPGAADEPRLVGARAAEEYRTRAAWASWTCPVPA